MENDYEKLSIKAITILSPFATYYLCETGFHRMQRSRKLKPNESGSGWIQLSEITPNLKTVLKKTMERF